LRFPAWLVDARIGLLVNAVFFYCLLGFALGVVFALLLSDKGSTEQQAGGTGSNMIVMNLDEPGRSAGERQDRGESEARLDMHA
jgi:hypothetical protein